MIHSSSPQDGRSRAMSLIELLAVITVIGLLIALAVPSIINAAQGQGMKRAVNDVSGILEAARTEAMATSTWVWVSFSNHVVNDSTELLVGIAASRDGTTNTAADNLTQIMRPLRLERVKTMSTLTPWAKDGSVSLNSSSINIEFTQRVGGTNQKFSKPVIAFTPRGEATLNMTSVPSWIEVGLREVRGTTEITNKTASLQVSGVSGQVNVNY